MDVKTFGPLVGELLNAGSPAISTALQMAVGTIPVIGGVAGPLVGMSAPMVLSMIAGQLGVNDPGAPPEVVAQKVTDTIAADPHAAEDKLAGLEAQHTFTLSSQGQQIDLLKLDAGRPGLAGLARPLTMLGIGFMLALELGLPYIAWAAQWATGHAPPPLPEPRFDVTVALISGLLGLGVLRTADKVAIASAVKTTKR
jgi:hypothetical protein